MKNLLSVFISLSILCTPIAAYGQDLPVVVSIKKDEAAPYSGLLINPQAAAGIMSDKRVQQDVIKNEVERAVGAAAAQFTLKLKESETSCKEKAAVSDAELKLREAAIKALEAELKRNQDSAKWTPLWVSAGVVGGIAAALVGGFVYSSASK